MRPVAVFPVRNLNHVAIVGPCGAVPQIELVGEVEKRSARRIRSGQQHRLEPLVVSIRNRVTVVAAIYPTYEAYG